MRDSPFSPSSVLTAARWAHLASAGKWVCAPHLALLNRKLMEVASGRLPRLIISMPPRHGKSELTSKYFPSWYLGTFPERRVILASYAADFAADWGRAARVLLEEYGPPVFGVRVSKTSSAADRWDLDGHAGGMVTAGIGGPLTGRGAHLFIIDDPIKNDQEAFSEVTRRRHKEWFRSTAYTRLEPGGGVVVMCTRWHEDDLAGWLQTEWSEGGERWEVLNLPAVAEEGRSDPVGRRPGEALWPDRFPVGTLYEIRRTLGGYWFAALYQGAPRPSEGNKFKRQWFKYWAETGDYFLLAERDGAKRPVRKRDCRLFGTVDLAFSQRTSADYTVIGVWAVTPDGQLLLLDVIRDRFAEPDLVSEVRRVYHREALQYVVVESVGPQLGVVQTLRRGYISADGAHHDGIAVRSISAHPDKVAWASTAVIVCEAGQLYLPERAPWLDEYEAELLGFPNATHDDQVDVTSMACNDCFNLGGSAIETAEIRAVRASEEEEVVAARRREHLSLDNDYWWEQ